MDKKLLLHICCAPDATVPCPSLQGEGYVVAGFFYGSNIHPEEEYLKRRDAVAALSRIYAIEAVMAEYNPEAWYEAAAIYSEEPEGGERCALCFRLQLAAAAEYAVTHDFSYMSTTLTISPHKNVALINDIGRDIAEKHGLFWVEKIWRKNDGFRHSVEESKRLNLYRQNYCGCAYSARGIRLSYQ